MAPVGLAAQGSFAADQCHAHSCVVCYATHEVPQEQLEPVASDKTPLSIHSLGREYSHLPMLGGPPAGAHELADTWAKAQRKRQNQQHLTASLVLRAPLLRQPPLAGFL